MALKLAIYSDVICPWCLVGKRRLERALDEVGLRDDAAIAWLPFELNPDMPADGRDRAGYRAAKFGAARSAELDAEMTARGREEGITFAFERQPRTPNTRRAHMLIAHASERGRADPVVEALFRAYFEDGRDIGDPATLVEIAAAAGLDRADAEGAVGDDRLRHEVERLEGRGAELGITGVPFFIVDQRWAVSGAQPSGTWVAALRDRVLAERRETEPA